MENGFNVISMCPSPYTREDSETAFFSTILLLYQTLIYSGLYAAYVNFVFVVAMNCNVMSAAYMQNWRYDIELCVTEVFNISTEVCD